MEAILLAAKMFQENLPTEDVSGVVSVGDPILRVDAREKVLGTGQYPDDVYLDDMIYASAVRAKYPRARVLGNPPGKGVGTGRCDRCIYSRGYPGVCSSRATTKLDWDTMIPVGHVTHYIGDAVCRDRRRISGDSGEGKGTDRGGV